MALCGCKGFRSTTDNRFDGDEPRFSPDRVSEGVLHGRMAVFIKFNVHECPMIAFPFCILYHFRVDSATSPLLGKTLRSGLQRRWIEKPAKLGPIAGIPTAVSEDLVPTGSSNKESKERRS